MPNWKKVIVSGSDAVLNSVTATAGLIVNGSFNQASASLASGLFAHAQGFAVTASGNYSHAEGEGTKANGKSSHAEGWATIADGEASHAEGQSTTATGYYSHAEGAGTTATGFASHAEGLWSIASGDYQHVQGQYNISSSAQSAFIVGNGTGFGALRSNLIFASGSQVQITGSLSVTGSVIATAGFTGSLQGTATLVTVGLSSSAAVADATGLSKFYPLFGSIRNDGGPVAALYANSGSFQYIMGTNTLTVTSSYANQALTASFALNGGGGGSSFPYTGSAQITGSLGITGSARINGSFNQGFAVTASGIYSHAEGLFTVAAGQYSHAEGNSTTALGRYSHAEGLYTTASNNYSHAEGLWSIASGDYQHVQGQYNISSSAQSAFIVGNGTADGARSNLIFASGSTVQITGSLIVSGSGTFTGTQTLSGSLIFATPTSPAFNGEIVRFGSGTLTTGQLYFLSSSGTWSLANANSTGSSTGMLGIATGTSPTANGLLVRGYAVSSSYTTATGSIVYAATSSGLMTTTSPSSSNHVVRVVGYVTTIPNTIYFAPDPTFVTLA